MNAGWSVSEATRQTSIQSMSGNSVRDHIHVTTLVLCRVLGWDSVKFCLRHNLLKFPTDEKNKLAAPCAWEEACPLAVLTLNWTSVKLAVTVRTVKERYTLEAHKFTSHQGPSSHHCQKSH